MAQIDRAGGVLDLGRRGVDQSPLRCGEDGAPQQVRVGGPGGDIVGEAVLEGEEALRNVELPRHPSLAFVDLQALRSELTDVLDGALFPGIGADGPFVFEGEASRVGEHIEGERDLEGVAGNVLDVQGARPLAQGRLDVVARSSHACSDVAHDAVAPPGQDAAHARVAANVQAHQAGHSAEALRDSAVQGVVLQADGDRLRRLRAFLSQRLWADPCRKRRRELLVECQTQSRLGTTRPVPGNQCADGLESVQGGDVLELGVGGDRQPTQEPAQPPKAVQ